MRNKRDLCGMEMIWLTFRFAGELCLMSFQQTRFQQPSCTLSSASLRHAAAALGACALGWAPCVMAAWISLSFQCRPQSTGQPWWA